MVRRERRTTMTRKCEVCGQRDAETVLIPSYAPGKPKNVCWACHDDAVFED
jgi:hypothetical protein